ncbi:MAG: hypothetical protein RIE56_02105 [Amphiplicatus sp.]
MIQLTDEMLTAYLDGEASLEEKRAIENAIEQDPDLRQTLERYRALKATIDRSFAGVVEQPVPQRIIEAASAPYGAYAAPLPPRRPSKWLTPTAMAASLAVGALAGSFLMRGQSADENALIASAPIEKALSGHAADTASGAIHVVATYRAGDDRVCREFEIADAAQTSAGIACLTTSGRWSLAALEPRPPVGAYLPASGDTNKTSLVSSLTGEMRAMTAEEEAAFLASLKAQR